jgi:hypothetical protein
LPPVAHAPARAGDLTELAAQEGLHRIEDARPPLLNVCQKVSVQEPRAVIDQEIVAELGVRGRRKVGGSAPSNRLSSRNRTLNVLEALEAREGDETSVLRVVDAPALEATMTEWRGCAARVLTSLSAAAPVTDKPRDHER